MALMLAVPRVLAGLSGLLTSPALSHGFVHCALRRDKCSHFQRTHFRVIMTAQHHRKVALFDATGTLMAPSEPIGETYGRLAREYGLHLGTSDEIESRFRGVYGNTAAVDYTGLTGSPRLVEEREVAWWRQIVSGVFAGESSNTEAFQPCFDELFHFFGTGPAWKLYPESMTVLRRLSEEGWIVGICSNFDHRLPTILQELGVMDVAEFVVLPGDCGCIKPARGIFAKALQRAGVGEGDAGAVKCMHVGDSIATDVVGAVEAGAFPVLVDRRGKYRSAPPPPPVPASCPTVSDLLPVVEAATSVPPMARLPFADRGGPALLLSPDDIS